MFHEMFDNSQSGDKKGAQILGECAVVYATETHGPETACLYGCVSTCTDNSHTAVFESNNHQRFNLSLSWPFC